MYCLIDAILFSKINFLRSLDTFSSKIIFQINFNLFCEYLIFSKPFLIALKRSSSQYIPHLFDPKKKPTDLNLNRTLSNPCNYGRVA